MPASTRHLLLALAFLVVPAILVAVWLRGAASSLNIAPEAAADVAIASASEEGYCSQSLKQILRRVASACGLVQGQARGCKPADARSVVALAGKDFNAIFEPLADRARIIQFDVDATALDDGARRLVEQTWSDQRGASFFFVVARASTDGDPEYNRDLSDRRAHAVLEHLEQTFKDPDLRKEVGLMWLGADFAQLPEEFCTWQRSREGECTVKDINRSAFVAWIDCAI
ncbi:MAG: hypothetical protein JXR83_15445 [Deltaproteobacteria bacterium]|nr:hypothetical protein [Deltaproteobacteria bacterium]